MGAMTDAMNRGTRTCFHPGSSFFLLETTVNTTIAAIVATVIDIAAVFRVSATILVKVRT